ncbi:hypothetical protein ACJX0J_030809, partial [Zea mays]
MIMWSTFFICFSFGARLMLIYTIKNFANKKPMLRDWICLDGSIVLNLFLYDHKFNAIYKFLQHLSAEHVIFFIDKYYASYNIHHPQPIQMQYGQPELIILISLIVVKFYIENIDLFLLLLPLSFFPSKGLVKVLWG